MKKNFLLLGLAVAFALVSCGGAKEESKDEETEEKAPVCQVENSIAVTIQDYHYQMSDTLEFATADFEVIASEYTWINDSTVSFKLSNYDPKDLVGARTPEQVDINVDIYARKGKSLEPGYYALSDYQSGMYSTATFATAYGKVWFNWVMGMPKQGGVTIEYVGEDAICGTFSINNEKADNDMIGIVRLNGTFVHKK